VVEPEATAERWARILGVSATGSSIELDGNAVGFGAAERERLREVSLAVPAAVRRGREAVDIGGVRFSLRDAG
jgi:hypothetical protein